MFSWFKKKQQPQTAPKINLNSLPALNEWAQFFQGNGLTISSRQAGTLPDGTPYVFFKSYPEVRELERCYFGDWLYLIDNGVILERIDSADGSQTAIVFVNVNTLAFNVLKEGENIRVAQVIAANGPRIVLHTKDSVEIITVELDHE